MRYQNYFIEGLLLAVLVVLWPVRAAQDISAVAEKLRRAVRRRLR